jgi:hypothetical protein
MQLHYFEFVIGRRTCSVRIHGGTPSSSRSCRNVLKGKLVFEVFFSKIIFCFLLEYENSLNNFSLLCFFIIKSFVNGVFNWIPGEKLLQTKTGH